MTKRTSSHPRPRFAAWAGSLIVAAGVAVGGGFAQDAVAPAAPAVGPDTVVATIGDQTITEGDLAFAAEDLGQDLANVPVGDRRAFLLTVLIDMKVMANAARAAQMDQTELFQRRLTYLEERALRRAYFAEVISAAVTPEALQAAYDAMIAGYQPEEEVRARHILVATEADALALKAEIDAGASFEQLATENSMDPSGAQNGGDLGFFGRGMMVPPFEQAAFALEPGQVSAPVQSQFGWHIIRLEERRQSAPPTMQQLGPQLEQQLLFSTFDEIVGGLKAAANINIPDPALAAAVQAQAEPAGGAAPSSPPAPPTP